MSKKKSYNSKDKKKIIFPYLESLLDEHGDILVDVKEKYPNPLVKDKACLPILISNSVITLISLKLCPE